MTVRVPAHPDAYASVAYSLGDNLGNAESLKHHEPP